MRVRGAVGDNAQVNIPSEVADPDAERPSSPLSGVMPNPARPTPRLVVGGAVVGGVLALVTAGLGLRWWFLRNRLRTPV